ncbi:MAG: hypothetical protein C0404_06715 [Verrucomicrobia bacterium]|nr:hypothetical protein [Verrucomicrobiota bacterium]
MTGYQQLIREILTHAGRIGTADPRHIEAWMRVEHPTLDALTHELFVAEVGVALQCIAAASVTDNESLAQSYGL